MTELPSCTMRDANALPIPLVAPMTRTLLYWKGIAIALQVSIGKVGKVDIQNKEVRRQSKSLDCRMLDFVETCQESMDGEAFKGSFMVVFVIDNDDVLMFWLFGWDLKPDLSLSR